MVEDERLEQGDEARRATLMEQFEEMTYEEIAVWVDTRAR